MGSPHTWKPNTDNLVKTIIKDDFKDYDSMRLFETEIIRKYIDKKLNRNAHIPDVGFYCKGHTEETKQRISSTLTGFKRPPRTIEHTENQRLAHSGKIHTEEHKNNISKSLKGKPKPPRSEEHGKRISESNKGILKGKQKISICPHCNKEGGISLMTRYHFDKCKSKKK